MPRTTKPTRRGRFYRLPEPTIALIEALSAARRISSADVIAQAISLYAEKVRTDRRTALSSPQRATRTTRDGELDVFSPIQWKRTP